MNSRKALENELVMNVKDDIDSSPQEISYLAGDNSAYFETHDFKYWNNDFMQ